MMNLYNCSTLYGAMAKASLESRFQPGIPIATMNIDGRNHTKSVSADGTEDCLSAFWGFTIGLDCI